MAKPKAEHSNSLSIFWLKKHGYLDGGYKWGNIKWTYRFNENESSIGFTVVTNIKGEEDRIKLQYTHKDRWTGEQENLDYEIKLTTSPCNYGGIRYWFICPLTKNGQYCGRQVGVLFSVGKYFGCRHCGNIAYSSQMEGGKFRGSSVSLPDIEKAEKEVKRKYYNGKITRKYKKVIKMNQRLNNDLVKMAVMLGK